MRRGGGARSGPALFAAGLFAASLLSAAPARASLTTSERAQLRDFVAGARAENAGRVRALVARTDLTQEESRAALVEATRPVAFTPQRARFFHEMTFASSSAASRPVLVRALVHALLARADAVHQRYLGGLDHEPRAVDELAAIYRFVDEDIANAGRPTALAADPANGIPRATYEDCVAAMAQHLDANRRWLKGNGPVPVSIAGLRAQAQIALLDLAPQAATRYVDLAPKLDLSPARRELFTRHGLLLADAGEVSEKAAERLSAWVARLPHGHEGVSVLFASRVTSALRARGAVLYAPPSLPAYPFGDEVSPAAWDGELARLVTPVADRAAAHAVGARATFGAIVQRDVAAARGELGRVLGRPTAPSVPHVLSGAILALVVDGRRAVDSALARHLVGVREPAALLSDALAVLAAEAAGDRVTTGAPDGALEITDIKTAASGEVSSFTLGGAAYALERTGPEFVVGAVKRGGAPLSIAHLAAATVPVTQGAEWADAGVRFTRLRGAPRAGVVAGPIGKDGRRAGPTVRLVGAGTSGLDAIAITPPGDDVTVELDLSVSGGRGGIAVRATPTRTALRGVALLVGPRVELVAIDDAGKETPLAPSIERPSLPAHVVVRVRGSDVEATVSGASLKGTVPPPLRRGGVALVAPRGASVQVGAFSMRK